MFLTQSNDSENSALISAFCFSLYCSGIGLACDSETLFVSGARALTLTGPALHSVGWMKEDERMTEWMKVLQAADLHNIQHDLRLHEHEIHRNEKQAQRLKKQMLCGHCEL